MQRAHRGVPTVITGLLSIAGLIFASSGAYDPTTVQAAAASLFNVPLGERCEQHQGSFLDSSASGMLRRLGVVFYQEDRLTAFPDPSLGIGSLVTLCRAPEITINDAGTIRTIRSWAPDLQSLVVEQRLELAAKDEVDLALDAPLSNGTSFAITRVAETELVVNVSLPFSTKYKDDPTLEKGTLKTEQKGKVGNRADTYLIRRENGVEVSRQKIASQVTAEPVTEIIIRGTKVTVLGFGKATFCDNYNNALGQFIYGGGCLGKMSAAHNSLPFGTKVRVINLANGKSVVVTINDRGIQRSDVVIDLSQDAFQQIASVATGIISVRLEKE